VGRKFFFGLARHREFLPKGKPFLICK